jgi:hypothetical protein
VVFSCFHVARRLIKQAAAIHTSGAGQPMPLERVVDRLCRLLNWHLSTFDYYRKRKSQPAELARRLATIIADGEAWEAVLEGQAEGQMTVEDLFARLNALRGRWLSVADHFEVARNGALEQNRRVPGLTTAIGTLRRAAEEVKAVMDGTWSAPLPDATERRH